MADPIKLSARQLAEIQAAQRIEEARIHGCGASQLAAAFLAAVLRGHLDPTLLPRRDADEPLVTPAIAIYLQDWFDRT